MLSTSDTIMDAKTPILYKIFPALRPMNVLCIFLLIKPSLFSANQIYNLETPFQELSPPLSRLATLSKRQSQNADSSPPLPRLKPSTPNLHLLLLLLPPLVHLSHYRRCWLLLGAEDTSPYCVKTTRNYPHPPAKAVLDCGFAAHPSGLVLPADIEAVTLPLCVSNGSMDF